MSDARELERLINATEKALADDATGRDALFTLLDAFDGFPAVCKMLKQEFDGLPKNNPAKIKLLMLIVNAAIRFGTGGGGGGDLPQSEAELTTLLHELKVA